MSVDELTLHPGIWRGRGGHAACPTLPTGFAELDRYLPGGGWPRDALTEIVPDRYGIGELSLLMPALALLSVGTGRPGHWIVWVDPPFIPYASALERSGIEPGRLLMVRPSALGNDAPEKDRSGDKAGNNVLWAVEQALRSGSCAAVLVWLESANDRALRRLQLAIVLHHANRSPTVNDLDLMEAIHGRTGCSTRCLRALKASFGPLAVGLQLGALNPMRLGAPALFGERGRPAARNILRQESLRTPGCQRKQARRSAAVARCGAAVRQLQPANAR